MRRVRGVYDGARVVLLDPIALRPNTPVEVLVPEPGSDREHELADKLRVAGLVTAARVQRRCPRQASAPVNVAGQPVSNTIMEDRR